MQLLVVYLTAGAEQDLTGKPVTAETKAMKMPCVRSKLGGDFPQREMRYDSVKAGSHGPWSCVNLNRNQIDRTQTATKSTDR